MHVAKRQPVSVGEMIAESSRADGADSGATG